MFSVNAKPTPTRPAYTIPSRTPSITRRRNHSSSRMNSPLAASSVTGATTSPTSESGVPSTIWSSGLQHERGRGGHQRAPAEGQHQQPRPARARSGPARGRRDHRADRERRQHHADGQRAGRVGEHQHERHHAGAEQHQPRETTTVNTALPRRRGRREQLGRHGLRRRPSARAADAPGGPSLRRVLTCRVHTGQPIGCAARGTATRARPRRTVSDVTATAETADRPAEAAMTDESHDQPCPRRTPTFMRQGWGDRELDLPRAPGGRLGGARRAAAGRDVPRRAAGASRPAGSRCAPTTPTTGSAPDTAHVHLTGNQTSDAVLVIEDGEAVLYARPALVAARPTSSSATAATASCGPAAGPRCRRSRTRSASRCRHLDELEAPRWPRRPRPGCCAASTRASTAAVAARRGPRPRASPGCCRSCGWSRTPGSSSSCRRPATSPRSASRTASASGTTSCSTASAGSRARSSAGPARWATTSATTRSWAAAAHATTLHWIENTGPVTPGRAAAARHGRGGPQPLHRRRHPHPAGRRHASRRCSATSTTLVLDAQQAGIDAVRPGVPFQAPHDAAMRVLAHGLDGPRACCRCSAEEALAPDSKVYTRWTLHSTSHMLGLDVHDCAAAAPETYTHGDLAEGMVLTVEPGPVLPGGRPAGPRGAARHRHPHRGRHRGHRRRLAGTCRRRCPATPRRHRGVDGRAARLTPRQSPAGKS